MNIYIAHYHSLLFMVLYREALDRLCVCLNMYIVIIIIIIESYTEYNEKKIKIQK